MKSKLVSLSAGLCLLAACASVLRAQNIGGAPCVHDPRTDERERAVLDFLALVQADRHREAAGMTAEPESYPEIVQAPLRYLDNPVLYPTRPDGVIIKYRHNFRSKSLCTYPDASGALVTDAEFDDTFTVTRFFDWQLIVEWRPFQTSLSVRHTPDGKLEVKALGARQTLLRNRSSL